MRTQTAAAPVRRWALGAGLACLLAAATTTAAAAGVAMITDLQGKAVLSSGPRPGESVSILTEMDAGAKLELAVGASLVAFCLDSGDEYFFKGPATIEFRPGAPHVPAGAKPERRSSQAGRTASRSASSRSARLRARS